MAHLVIIPDAIASKLSTAVELARRLEGAGHRVTFFGPGPPPAVLGGRDHRALELRLRAVRGHGLARWFARHRRARQAAEAFDVEAFDSAVRSVAADAVLVDVECHEAILAANAGDRPVGLLNVFFNLWRDPACPPLDSDVSPRDGALAVRAAWWKSAARSRVRRSHERARTAGADRDAVLAALARRIGARLDVDRRAWLLPFVPRGVPMLTLNAWELEFPHRPQPESRYVGPLLRDEATAGDPAPDDRERLDRILERQSGSPLIYAGAGALKSIGGATFWKKLIAAVAMEGDWTLVLGLGGQLRPEALGELPPHVHAFAWAPQARVLGHAAAAVVHGGMTSVYECVRAGVPMVVCPFRVNDQLGTAARVAYRRLGHVLDRRTVRPAEIAAALRSALTDAERRRRVESLGVAVEAYRTSGAAVAAVERLLEWGRPGVPPGWSDLPRGADRLI